MKTTTKFVVGYVRVSTAGQAAEGVSLAAQRARIEAWAKATGAELASVHVDAGLSGAKAANRPGLQAALTAACRQKAALVVYSLSRLARSTKDAIEIGERLSKAGADLVSLTESLDTTSASGKMIFGVLSVLSQFERDLVSERTVSAMAHLRRQGRRISGRVPFGHDLQGDLLVPNPREQKELALIRTLRAEGQSLRVIASELESRGIRTKSGGRSWAPKVLAAVLRRDAGLRVAA